MIRIVSKEDKKIIFSKKEIEFSIFLNNLFFNNDYQNDDENNEDENIIEFKIPRITMESLTKIKNIIQYIINNNLEIDDQIYDNYNLNKFIEISETFTVKDFFELLDNVNYLHIDVIIKLMCKSIKEDIAYMHISNIEKKYDIDKNDLNDKIRLKFFEKIIYKDD